MRACLFLLALLAVGCGDDPFDAPSLLNDYKVLAIVADKPELGPADTVTLTAVEYDPAVLAPTQAGTRYWVWSVCLYSLGSVAQYACADPRLQFLRETTEPTLTLDLGPNGLNVEPVFSALEAQAAAEGETFELPVQVILHSGVEGVTRLDTVKSLKVKRSDAPNQNPVITALTIKDEAGEAVTEAPAGTTLALDLVVADPETYTTEDGTQTEELLYYWYATDGTFDREVGVDTQTSNTLTLPDTPGPLLLYAVVRDGRGGLATTSVRLEVR